MAHVDKDLYDELLCELEWSINRKNNGAHDIPIHDLVNNPDQAGPFFASLTEAEKLNQKDYIKAHPHGFTHQLNQFERNKRGVSSSSHLLQTITANASLHYNIDWARRLTPSKLLLAQGFPVLKRLSGGKRCCSFAPTDVQDKDPTMMPKRRRTTIMSQAGNSMQLVCAGTIFFYVMLCIDLKSNEEIKATEACLRIV